MRHEVAGDAVVGVVEQNFHILFVSERRRRASDPQEGLLLVSKKINTQARAGTVQKGTLFRLACRYPEAMNASSLYTFVPATYSALVPKSRHETHSFTETLRSALPYAAGRLAAFAEDLKKIHPTGYVTDLAGAIEAGTKSRLEALCTELQEKTGAQMAIVTVHSLEGQSVENYAVDLYKQLGVGSKQDNRGVLLLVSPDERKYRIEVGYGLEPVINDARAGDAGRAMVPFLRQGDYSKATETAAWMLAKYVADDRGVTLSGQPPARAARQPDSGSGGFPTWLISFSSCSSGFSAILEVAGDVAAGGGSAWWLWPLLFSSMDRGDARQLGWWRQQLGRWRMGRRRRFRRRRFWRIWRRQ